MKGLINVVNWPGQFPDKPEVAFELENCGDYLHLHFCVKEDETIASAQKNFDNVWEDSCCEMFIMFNGEDRYYNLETSCNGCQLFSYRKDRYDAENAPCEVMDSITCHTSLAKGVPFEACHIDEWSLDIDIPASAFWHSGLKSFEGVKAKGNLYKCVQSLSRQHFLSLAPIDTPAPDFHQPSFFVPFDI